MMTIQSISYDAAIGYYFAVLGVFVTLISISLALNQEVRQKLIVKYYSKDGVIRLYLLFIVLSFSYVMISIILNFMDWRGILIKLTICLFFLSIAFVMYFINNLNRAYFNALVCASLEKKLKKRKSNEFPDELNDFLSNIGFVHNKNLDFEDEEVAFRSIIKMSLDYNSPNLIGDLITRLQNMNEYLFDTFITVLYKERLKSKIFFKQAIIYQTLLSKVITAAFKNCVSFSPRLNTSGLYLKEFFDVRLIEAFENTTSNDEIKSFHILATNTIDFLFNLNLLIIKIKLDENLKKEYLTAQMGELNKALDYLDHLRETDFFRRYYDYKFDHPEKEEIKLADLKMSMVKDLESYLQRKKESLFYIILHNISKKDLSKAFFEIAVKIFHSKGFKAQFIKGSFVDLGHLNYDWFEGGAQALRFEENKYKLLMIFSEYLLDKGKIKLIQELEKENFFDSQSPFISNVDKLTLDFVKTYIDTDEQTLNDFKTALKSEIEIKIKEIRFKEKRYYADSKAKKPYVDTFKKDVLDVWEQNQKKLGNILKIDIKPGGSKINEYFGQYKLDQKEWFLDSFYSNVAKARDTGKWYGKWQIDNKNCEIMRRFSVLVRKTNTVPHQNFVDVIKKILKPNCTYYFAYDNRQIELYAIKNLEWLRDETFYAQIKLEGNIVVKFLNFRLENLNLLFEKNAVTLKQYSNGFMNNKAQLLVDVNDITDKNEIKTIMESMAEKRSEDEVKGLVKIRIAEKFEVGFDKRKFATNILIE